jgi:phosphoribosyl 1,2-cyclic phosphodiesterase
MRVRIWGCRGSVAAPGADTVKYGGNTSCVEVKLGDGVTIVLDAGTGIRALGVALQRDPPRELHVMLTHLHMDHLQGLGFFRPLFTPGCEVHLWGPASAVQHLDERIAMYLSPPLFPVRLRDLPARVVFHDAPIDEIEIGSARVRAATVMHQGPTLGYRIDDGNGVLVYIPDHEPALGTDLTRLPADWMSGHDIAHDADVLLHDGQYRDDEYPMHIGWGHSSVTQAIEFAGKSRVANLVLFHHDPYHTDEDLEEVLTGVYTKWPETQGHVILASEGMTIELDDSGISIAR